MGAHGPASRAGGNMLMKDGVTPLSEIPFHSTILEIEDLRAKITKHRNNCSGNADFDEKLLDLEDELRSAYAALAANAAAKVARWTKGPKGK